MHTEITAPHGQAGPQLSKFLVVVAKWHRNTAPELMEREMRKQHMGHVCCSASDLPGASLQLLPWARQGPEYRGGDISLAVSKRPFFSLISHSPFHPLPGKI